MKSYKSNPIVSLESDAMRKRKKSPRYNLENDHSGLDMSQVGGMHKQASQTTGKKKKSVRITTQKSRNGALNYNSSGSSLKTPSQLIAAGQQPL